MFCSDVKASAALRRFVRQASSGLNCALGRPAVQDTACDRRCWAEAHGVVGAGTTLPADVNQELLGLGLFNGDVLDEQPQHSLAVLGMGGASMPYTLNAIYEQDFLDCKCAGAERPRGPSAFRRGTCDRGIWMKPLAFAADAGELIFYLWVFMAVSLLDRLRSARSPDRREM